MTPNKENIRKWVEALRSGDYTQTQHRLADLSNGKAVAHCCLGVACEVAGIEPKFEGVSISYDGWVGTMSPSTQELFGIDNFAVGTLSRMNDDGATFDEIADCIEAKYLS